MKIVIIGLGAIGQTVLKRLCCGEHSITIIDEDKELIESLIERFDVFGIVGNGACMDIQQEANVCDADLVIALTRNDELNIFACLVAKQLGVRNTVARVRNPAYSHQIMQMQGALGISMVVNPEKETANAIFHMINLPAVARVEYFAKGKALLVEMVVPKASVLEGKSLITIGKELMAKILICAVQRKDQVVIPSGNFQIEAGDRIYFTADSRNLRDFLMEVRMFQSPLKKILIVGGGRTGFYLANELSGKKYTVKLIEEDFQTADDLAERLPKVRICCGNGTKHELLLEEGIQTMDAFVTLTGADEENIIVSMFANKMGVPKTITQIENDDLIDMLDQLEVKNLVSSKNVVADRIVSYVRALANSRGSNILTLYQLVNNQVEAVEFCAKSSEPIYNKPLRDLKIKKGCLVSCIVRNNEVIIPNGSTEIHLGDNIVVITTHKNLEDLGEVFE